MRFLVAAAAAFLITPLARRIGLASGLVDRGGDPLKIHEGHVPVFGGLAVLVSTGVVTVALRGAIPLGAAVGVIMATAIGLADDIRPLSPRSRMVGLAAAGGMLMAGGIRFEPLGVAGGLTVIVLVVAFANAVNLIDGQDGLAAGLCCIGALGLAVLASWGGVADTMRLSITLAGALAGYLLWNRPPARIFLGNSGAYGLGVLMAVLATPVASTGGWVGVLAVAVCLLPLVFDVVFTVARRLRSGTPLTTGDRSHSYDVLAQRLGGRTRSTLAYWAFGAVAAGLALAVGSTVHAAPR